MNKEKTVKTKSYLLGVPVNESDVMDIKGIFQRLEAASDFSLISHRMSEEGTVVLQISYQEETYEAEFCPQDFTLPELFRTQHLFHDVDVQQIEQREVGVAVDMLFGEHPLQSYHLHLKLMDTILPDKLAVFDYSSEKILSGKWVGMAAKSAVAPAPRYIHTAQAVGGENGQVWLHTHGLNRCGMTELEILNSQQDTYQRHYQVIEGMANRLLETEAPFVPKEEVMYLAQLAEDISLMTTLIPWEEAVSLYDDDLLGGKNDREESHNEYTSAIFVYASAEDYDQRRYQPVAIYDDLLEGNPMYMVSNAETARMRALARERISCVYTAFPEEKNKILLKIALEVDEEHRTEDNCHEHIWFALQEISGDQFTAELTQEPYFVKDMHTGSIGTYGVKDVTDWIIFAPESRISPDDAYLLDEKMA